MPNSDHDVHEDDAARGYKARCCVARAGPRASRALGMRLLVWSLTLQLGCAALPEIEVAVEGESATSESGGSVVIAVSLGGRPSGVVTVSAQSSDETEGTASAPLHFDRDNWQDVQTIVVAGVDDGLSDGDVPYRVTFTAVSSERPTQAPRLVSELLLVNHDDERPAPTIDILGRGREATFASDVSASGEVVVGSTWSSPGSRQAYRWSAASGLQLLDGDDGQGLGVSPDGRFVVGTVSLPNELVGAARWTGAAQPELLAGAAPTQGEPPLLAVTAGYAALDDGRVFGSCLRRGAAIGPLGCRWEAPNLVELLPNVAVVFAADAHERYAGALLASASPPDSAPAAVFNGARLPYPFVCQIGQRCEAEARAFSADGQLVVGTARAFAEDGSKLRESAFVYSAGEGTRALPDLNFGSEESGALDISGDGRVIVGFGTNEGGREAALWVDGLPQVLRALLPPESLMNFQLFSFRELVAISADGRTLVGNASGPGSSAPLAFRVVLPSAP